MAEQRRIGYRWNLRQLMAQRNLWKTTELLPLLKSRGINLSNAQVYRLVTGTPERIPAQTFAALCDILDCTPNDLFEPLLEMRAAKTAECTEKQRRPRGRPRPHRSRDGSGVDPAGRRCG